MNYTKKQRKALKVFSEYIECEQPYKDMDEKVYKKLGEYYHDLPKEVFSVPPSRSLYHISNPGRTEHKLTDSGIVSCTTYKGKDYIDSEWCVRNGDIWWRLSKRKAVDAKKLYEVACSAGVLSEQCWLERRVHNEDEYILPLEKVRVLSRKVVKR